MVILTKATGGGVAMNNILGKITHYYYLTILCIFSAIITFGIYFYWSNGPVNIENINNIFNASSKIEQIRNSKGLKPVLSLVKKYKVRPAIKKLEKLNIQTKSFGSDFDIQTYEDFQNEMKTVKKRLYTLLSYPEINSVFIVLLKKISKFENFVISKNWKTLTRISKRTRTKIAIGKSTIHSARRMNKLVVSTTKDINMMASLTKSSILSKADKDQVLTKLDALKVEVNMLGKYLKSVTKFNRDFKLSNSSFDIWVNELAPYISLKKIDFERHSQNFLFALVIFLSLSLLSILLGLYIFKSERSKNKNRMEDLILDVVKDTLVPLEANLKHEMSEEFTKNLEKFREYLHKRMSFGSIFQDAMPFASILLDSNLNMVWSNSIFCETWGITSTEAAEGNITWDYIGQYTNLGVTDPILCALEDQIGGIYQIQFKRKTGEGTIPYEMYVSPVSYAKQNRVMIIFYPLRGAEETLKNQTQSLVGPISRTLDAFSTGQFDEEFIQKVQKDFDIANIENVFEKFTVLDKLQKEERDSFTFTINQLESDNQDFRKALSDITLINDEEKELHNITKNHFVGTKNSIVDSMGLKQELEELLLASLNNNDISIDHETRSLSLLKNAYFHIDKLSQSMNKANETQKELQEVKNSLAQVRSRIVSGIDTVRAKKQTDYTMSKLQDDFLEFEKFMRTFSKIVINLDANLNHSNMSEGEFNALDIEGYDEQLLVNREDLHRLRCVGEQIMGNAQLKEEGMVESLGHLYSSFKDSRQKSLEVNPLLMN